jgi:glycosyltransferase involved in cell wall biosynthesis
VEENIDKMKKIWLVNHYAMPPELEPRLRTIKFAEYLTKNGYDVTIFGASSMHNMELNLITGREDYIEKQYGKLDFVHVRAKSYFNYFERVLNLLEFPIRLSKVARKFDKPDIILHTATVPFGNMIYFLAKKLNAKYYVEVLDLWPESFVMTGIVNKKNPIMPILYYFEKWLYKRADRVIFSMEGGKDYILEKKWDKDNNGQIDINKVSYINNGVDLYDFNNNLDKFSIEDDDLNNDGTFKIIYIGSIRLFNNVQLLVEAAEKLLNYKDIVFLIYGDGDERKSLENYAEKNSITNVRFKDKFIDKKYIPYLLSKSSINVLNYQQNGIWKYGGSQSKLFQYLASGRPIVSNIVHRYCLIRKYSCGISEEFKTAEEYANAFKAIKSLSKEEYDLMCRNAKETAELFDYEKLTDDLIQLL